MTRSDKSDPQHGKPAQMRAAGVPFLCCGVVFVALGSIPGSSAFLGVGLPMLVLGIVFMAQGRTGKKAGRDRD